MTLLVPNTSGTDFTLLMWSYELGTAGDFTDLDLTHLDLTLGLLEANTEAVQSQHIQENQAPPCSSTSFGLSKE